MRVDSVGHFSIDKTAPVLRLNTPIGTAFSMAVCSSLTLFEDEVADVLAPLLPLAERFPPLVDCCALLLVPPLPTFNVEVGTANFVSVLVTGVDKLEVEAVLFCKFSAADDDTATLFSVDRALGVAGDGVAAALPTRLASIGVDKASVTTSKVYFGWAAIHCSRFFSFGSRSVGRRDSLSMCIMGITVSENEF